MRPLQSADPAALARQVPGFGGFFFDQQGKPTIYLKDLARRPDAERALGAYLAAHGVGTAALQVRRGDFDWASLERWQGHASAEALALRGAVWVDEDESRNRVMIGVERGTSAAQVVAAVARLGVPATAVLVQEVEPSPWRDGICDLVQDGGDLRRVPFEPYVAELRRWQKMLNRVTELDEDPFSDPVELQDVIDAAHRLQLQPDKNWS